jgi:biofilm PGA synthesis N-glycosyltransferase PgaC
LTITDHVIRAVSGKKVGYFRLPYQGADEPSTRAAIEGVLRSQRYCYLVASHDYDNDDWRCSSHELKGEVPLPELAGQPVTVLLHDGGGGHEVTIEYVRKLIAQAKSRSYTFTTMPDVNPWLADRVFDVKPTILDKLTLNLVQLWFVWPSVLLRALFAIAVIFVVVIGLGNCVIAAIRRHRRKAIVWPPAIENPVPVSVLLAAYNEEQIIDRALRSVLASQYPLAEVIVVKDGSTDGTDAKVEEIARPDPRVHFVNQENTGKAGAHKAGLEKASSEITMTLDADTLLIDVVVFYFMLFLAAHLIIAAVGICSCERSGGTCWWCRSIESFTSRCGPICCTQPFTWRSVASAPAGTTFVRAGTSDTCLVTVHKPAQQAVATAGMTQR